MTMMMKPVIDGEMLALFDRIQVNVAGQLPDTLETHEQAQAAKETSLLLKDIANELDKRRLELTKPLRDEQERVNAQVKPYVDQANQRSKLLIALANDYVRREDARRKEEERKRLANLTPAPATLPANVIEIQTRKVWKCRVINKSEVPLEFMDVNEGRVMAAIRAGRRDIPGVHIYQDEEAVRR